MKLKLSAPKKELSLLVFLGFLFFYLLLARFKFLSTPSPVSPEGLISGSVGYPSDGIPDLKICAINTKTRESICTDNPKNTNRYSIEVPVGSYYVYATVVNSDFTAYHIDCDASPSSCDGRQARDWHFCDFNCSQDEACRAYYRPRKVVVSLNNSPKEVNILQGWYAFFGDGNCNSKPSVSNSIENWGRFITWD